GLWAILPPSRALVHVTVGSIPVIIFFYMVPLKSTKGGSLGYRLFGFRTVGLNGQTASIASLTFRLAFLPLGPLNWLLDLAWLSGAPHRQTIRDKFANTYLVKATAQPVGVGVVTFQHYDIFGCSFMFREIKSQTASSKSASADAAGSA